MFSVLPSSFSQIVLRFTDGNSIQQLTSHYPIDVSSYIAYFLLNCITSKVLP